MMPPEFVKTRMRPHETLACHQYYNFRLTSSEVKAWQKGKESVADRRRPIEERRRWFTPSRYTEPRLCRYRDSMHWPETVSFPFNAGYVASERLPIRHYPHRDPAQLQRRCRLRAIMMADPENACNLHWACGDWLEHIISDNSLDLHYWKPGTDLPELHFTNHLGPLYKRAAQRIAHAWLLPLLDRLRTSFPDAAYPRRIPSGLIHKLNEELSQASVQPRMDIRRGG
jgi:hypothetical protein